MLSHLEWGLGEMSSVARALLSRRNDGIHDATMGLIATLLAAIVFYVDSFTEIEGAVAVLYVLVLLLSADILTRAGLTAVAGVCIGLSLFSYFYSHGPTPDLQPTLRLTVALAALVITATLLVRNKAAQMELIERNGALRDSEARYRSIFDRTRVALWERDYSRVRGKLMDLRAQGVTDIRDYARTNPDIVDECVGLIRTVAANEAARELLGPGSGPDSSMRRFIIPGNDKFPDLLQAIMDGARFFEGKVDIRTESGEDRLVLLSLSFPEDPAAFNRVVVGMIDVTQREMAQKALAEAQAELTRASRAATVGALSASLAHELNQPLGAMVVNAQTLIRWLDREPPDLAAARRSAERMIRDSQRASEIIHNTRDLIAQSERKAEPLDLRMLVEETRALMEHDLQREFVSLDVVQKERIPSVPAVKIELQQVLINLITNAIQAITSAGSAERIITITLDHPAPEEVMISVRDSGPGIEKDALGKLFVPFHTTKKTGMGMGLSICRSTLEASGGSLDGMNHVDGGAVFVMKLPTEKQYA